VLINEEKKTQNKEVAGLVTAVTKGGENRSLRYYSCCCIDTPPILIPLFRSTSDTMPIYFRQMVRAVPPKVQHHLLPEVLTRALLLKALAAPEN
jgi:hypothetical protein